MFCVFFEPPVRGSIYEPLYFMTSLTDLRFYDKYAFWHAKRYSGLFSSSNRLDCENGGRARIEFDCYTIPSKSSCDKSMKLSVRRPGTMFKLLMATLFI